MDPSQILNLVSLVINAAIAAFMIKSMIGFFTVGGRGNMKVKSYSAFKYFTVQSNLLMAAVSLLMLVFNVIILINGGGEAPYWVIAVKHVGTVAVMLTFSVVMFIFVPATGLKFMIEGDSIYMHLISPLLALIAFVFLDRGPALSYTGVLYGMLPTALYAVLYYYKVMARGPERGGWEDFYKFNASGKWLLMAVVVFLMTAALGALLILGRNVFAAGLLA